MLDSDEVERAAEREKQSQAMLKEAQDAQAKGAAAKRMKLSPLLEAARKRYVIPDGAFAQRAIADTVFVFPLTEKMFEGGTYGKKSLIVTPDTVAGQIKAESSRGVLIGAGPLALDVLHSNGVELGHVVRFTYLVPYKLNIETQKGRVPYILVMQAGHVKASETLEEEIRSGEKAIVYEADIEEHRVRAGKKKLPRPRASWAPGDEA